MARINLRDVSTAIRTSEAFLAFPGKKLCVPQVVSSLQLLASAYGTIGSAPRKPVAMT
jgi:hypothetical protein